MRPRLLDLFCGAGGAARGYQRAGFHVTGVDVREQPRYAGDSFVRADALDYMAIPSVTEKYDAIHASPPCQAYSSLGSIHAEKRYPDLLGRTRDALIRRGRPWVIENVPGSPVLSGVTLCGSMFGLGALCRDGKYHQLRRHRHFEASFFLLAPPCTHEGRPVGVYGNGGGMAGLRDVPGINGFTGNSAERRAAMGIDWMNRGELSQAIPPAYTEWIGERLMSVLASGRPALVASEGGG